MEEIPILEQLIKITDIKNATEAYKAGQKAVEEGIFVNIIFYYFIIIFYCKNIF